MAITTSNYGSWLISVVKKVGMTVGALAVCVVILVEDAVVDNAPVTTRKDRSNKNNQGDKTTFTLATIGGLILATVIFAIVYIRRRKSQQQYANGQPLKLDVKYRRDGAYLFVWYLPSNRVGHLSFLLPDPENTYISFWPDRLPMTLQGFPGKASKSMWTLEDDIKEGRAPDDMLWIPIEYLDVTAAKSAWNKVNKTDRYSLFKTNIATRVRKVFTAACQFPISKDVIAPNTVFGLIKKELESRVGSDKEMRKIWVIRKQVNEMILQAYKCLHQDTARDDDDDEPPTLEQVMSVHDIEVKLYTEKPSFDERMTLSFRSLYKLSEQCSSSTLHHDHYYGEKFSMDESLTEEEKKVKFKHLCEMWQKNFEQISIWEHV